MLGSPASLHGRSLAHAELDRKADLCWGVLGQAEERAASAPGSVVFVQLVHRAIDLLDEIDEILVSLNVSRRHATFVRAAELHRRLEVALSRVPKALRSSLRR